MKSGELLQIVVRHTSKVSSSQKYDLVLFLFDIYFTIYADIAVLTPNNDSENVSNDLLRLQNL